MHVNVLNVLTGIRLRLYSSGMTVEFNLLAEKISQLAEMAQTLRRENADLRRSVAAVAAENADLSQRMDSAHERVTALLAQMPDEMDAEIDAEIDPESDAEPNADAQLDDEAAA